MRKTMLLGGDPRPIDRASAPEHSSLKHVGKRDRGKKHLNLSSQFFPEVMREAAAGSAKTTLGAIGTAARRFDRFVNGNNNVCNSCLRCRLCQAVTAFGATSSDNQSAAPQLHEQLLEIGQRYLLALGNFRQGNMAISTHPRMPGKVRHSHDGVPSSRA